MPKTEEDQQESSPPWASMRDDIAPISGLLGILGLILLAAEAVLGVWLRFSAPQQLWLDEALTVNIAKLPLGSMHQALKQDGAPPLYYLVLHVWIALFGSSNFAVRSLSGLLSCATIVVVYFVARRVWGREVALLSVALLFASSFAIYYATETRMYSMVMLLSALAALFVVRLFEQPSWRWMLPLGLTFAALEYTHYWALYLFVTLGVVFLWNAWRGAGDRQRRAGRWGLVSFVLAGLLFLPWLPTFAFQSKHTGTPWGEPPHLATFVVALFHYNHNQMREIPLSGLAQRIAEVLMVLLMVLALFFVAKGRGLSFRWRTVPRARAVAWFAVGTLEIGLLACRLSGNAFAPRYGSVCYLALIVFLALGTQALGVPVLRVLLVGLLAGSTIAVAIQQRSTPRTQAPQVVRVLEQQAPAGSVVLFCPDQLGPTVMRLLPDKGYKTYGYPRFDDPHFINWVDYNKALAASKPSGKRGAVAKLEGRAAGKPIWLVSAPGYMQAGFTCRDLRYKLNDALPHKTWVEQDNMVYFQALTLTEYLPRG